MNSVDAAVARYCNLAISALLSDEDTTGKGKAEKSDDEDDVGTDLFAMLDRHTALAERRKVAWRAQCVARMRRAILTVFPLSLIFFAFNAYTKNFAKNSTGPEVVVFFPFFLLATAFTVLQWPEDYKNARKVFWGIAYVVVYTALVFVVLFPAADYQPADRYRTIAHALVVRCFAVLFCDMLPFTKVIAFMAPAPIGFMVWHAKQGVPLAPGQVAGVAFVGVLLPALAAAATNAWRRRAFVRPKERGRGGGGGGDGQGAHSRLREYLPLALAMILLAAILFVPVDAIRAAMDREHVHPLPPPPDSFSHSNRWTDDRTYTAAFFLFFISRNWQRALVLLSASKSAKVRLGTCALTWAVAAAQLHAMWVRSPSTYVARNDKAKLREERAAKEVRYCLSFIVLPMVTFFTLAKLSAAAAGKPEPQDVSDVVTVGWMMDPGRIGNAHPNPAYRCLVIAVTRLPALFVTCYFIHAMKKNPSLRMANTFMCVLAGMMTVVHFRVGDWTGETYATELPVPIRATLVRPVDNCGVCILSPRCPDSHCTSRICLTGRCACSSCIPASRWTPSGSSGGS